MMVRTGRMKKLIPSAIHTVRWKTSSIWLALAMAAVFAKFDRHSEGQQNGSNEWLHQLRGCDQGRNSPDKAYEIFGSFWSSEI